MAGIRRKIPMIQDLQVTGSHVGLQCNEAYAMHRTVLLMQFNNTAHTNLCRFLFRELASKSPNAPSREYLSKDSTESLPF